MGSSLDVGVMFSNDEESSLLTAQCSDLGCELAQKAFVAWLSGVIYQAITNNNRYIFSPRRQKTRERSNDNLNIYKLRRQ